MVISNFLSEFDIRIFDFSIFCFAFVDAKIRMHIVLDFKNYNCSLPFQRNLTEEKSFNCLFND